MSYKLAMILTAATQILGQSISTTQQRSVKSVSSQVTSTTSNSAVLANSINFPEDDLQFAQTQLLQNLKRTTAALQEVQSSFDQQFSGWYFSSPSIRSAFDKSISTVTGLFDQCNNYIQGGEQLLSAIHGIGGTDIQPVWIERIRKLQGLGELALKRATEEISSISRNVVEFSKDQEIYAAAKQQQLLETKSQMDSTLDSLLKQTLQVGVQASEVIQQAIKEWSGILKQRLAPDAAQTAILRTQQITQRVLIDLTRLRPEDIETAMTDAHRCIEDIKSLFYSSGIPANTVRQVVNAVQLSVFAILTRARSIHL